MKAAIIHEFGDFDVLKYEEVPTPEPRAGHVLVKVLAAGINRLDHYLREGSVVPALPFPHILGADAAGEVAALGDGANGFEIGDRVVVCASSRGGEASGLDHPRKDAHTTNRVQLIFANLAQVLI